MNLVAEIDMLYMALSIAAICIGVYFLHKINV